MLTLTLKFKNYRRPVQLVVLQATLETHVAPILTVRAPLNDTQFDLLRQTLSIMFARGQAMCYSPDRTDASFIPGCFVTVQLLDPPYEVHVEAPMKGEKH